MILFRHILIISVLLAVGAQAQTTDDMPWSIVPESGSTQLPAPQAPMLRVIAERSPLGLPGERPRLSVTMPLSGRQPGFSQSDDPASSFSWSLKAWQMNTASLAHIQCSQGMMTINSYLAQDCRFVDQPLPGNTMNLLQVSGDWMAAPGLKLGIGAYHGNETPLQNQSSFGPSAEPALWTPHSVDGAGKAIAGLDVNVSFGIETERIGDFLVGLQLARYRQRMSLSELGMALKPMDAVEEMRYANNAQLLLGWRRGNFSGEMLGQQRELPLWLSPEQASSTLSSFDLEFSWHAPRNGALSIGVRNIMDAAPRADEPTSDATTLED
ncbi:MAG TPA: hypothetical protein VK972_10115, partial [Wenzhouxiangella sp.]|nr:hypothetical protein [Wenzhouxiangella sp.]